MHRARDHRRAIQAVVHRPAFITRSTTGRRRSLIGDQVDQNYWVERRSREMK